MYFYKRKIMIRDADPAGVLYFARYYALSHEAFEEFMESKGLSFASLFSDEKAFMIPVIHSECDYRLSLWLGEEITVELTVAEIRRRKFTLVYKLRNSEGKTAARVKTSHVVVSRQTHKMIPLPETLLKILNPDISQ